MTKLNIKQFNDKNEEIQDILISLSVSRPIARILSNLQNVDEITSNEIVKKTGLTQPEVSLAMKQLKERDWITEREEKKPGKGRPYKIYSLKIGFNDIIVHLENQQKKAIDKTMASIHRLKGSGK